MNIQFFPAGSKTAMIREFKPISMEYTNAHGNRALKVIPKFPTTHDITQKEEVIEREAMLNLKTNQWEIRIAKGKIKKSK